jgi:hypothetical protein
LGLVISGDHTERVVLSDPASNTVVIDATADVHPANYGGVIGLSPTAWIIENSGLVDPAFFVYAPGIDLLAGGKITNKTGGKITGGGSPLQVGGDGVRIGGGAGEVVNANGAYIGAVDILGGYGKVLNSGQIASPVASGIAVQLLAGGYVANVSGANITGTKSYGVIVNGAAGKIVNDGSIAGTTAGASLLRGGYVFNQSAGFMSGVNFNQTASYLKNQGVIAGSTVASAGAGFVAGGTLVNGFAPGQILLPDPAQLTGNIYGANFIAATASTVTNYGTISATHQGFGSEAGLYLHGGGTVTNGDSIATITGANGIRFGASGSAGTLTNHGTVAGAAGYGAVFSRGGTVNNAIGYIAGGKAGIYGAGSSRVDVTNHGVIKGSGINGDGIIDGGGATITNLAPTGNPATPILSIVFAPRRAIAIGFGGATIFNGGVIESTGSANSSVGISLAYNSVVTNSAGAVVTGYSAGIVGLRGGTVTNWGHDSGHRQRWICRQVQRKLCCASDRQSGRRVPGHRVGRQSERFRSRQRAGTDIRRFARSDLRYRIEIYRIRQCHRRCRRLLAIQRAERDDGGASPDCRRHDQGVSSQPGGGNHPAASRQQNHHRPEFLDRWIAPRNRRN